MHPRRASLTGVRLIGVHLIGVHLIGVHPRRAALTGVHLIGAHPRRASLTGVDFMRLIGAYLSQACISYRHIVVAWSWDRVCAWRLPPHLVVCRRPSPSSFFILGIFVRIASS